LVLTPSKKLMAELEAFLANSPLVPDFKFPDQDLLAAVFRGRWAPLPWKYNALKTVSRTHPEIWRDSEVCCVHYILREKPWHFRRGDAPPQFEYLHEWWWNAFDRLINQMKQIPNSHWEVVEAQVAR
jgi:lipopolysaccharide biosynthesis glycosyltransferase